MSIASNGNSNNLAMLTTNSRWFQMYSYNSANGWLVNNKGKIAEVQGPINDSDQNGRNILVTDKKNDDDNKQWDVIYVKDMKPDLKTGDMNHDFGLKVNVDFHIISQMRRGRYIDIINSYDMVTKTPNGRRSQVWFFDNNTKTIKNRQSSSYSIEIKNSGKTNDMRIYSTYGRWW
jgi:hypothetical protein